MSQRAKLLILVVIILLATLVVGVYLVKKNTVVAPTVTVQNQPIAEANPQEQAQVVIDPVIEQKTQVKQEEINKQPSKSTQEVSVISGIISSITDKGFEIKNGESRIPFPLDDKIVLTLVDGKTGTIKDLKLGQLVELNINNSNSTVISIQVQKVD